MLRWIEILESIAQNHLERFPSPFEQSAELQDYTNARDKYLQITETANRSWGD